LSLAQRGKKALPEEVLARFREVQRFRQWWIWLLVYGIAIFSWYGFIQQIILGQPFGSNPAPDWAMWLIWVLFGIGFPLFFHTVKLEVTVLEDCVQIRYVPLASRRIPFQEIERFVVRTYSPIREFGGWGLRWGGRNRRAYNVSGNRGVELTLRDGGRVMLGSQRPEELDQALAGGLGRNGDLARSSGNLSVPRPS
jgi:hypothetical protein